MNDWISDTTMGGNRNAFQTTCWTDINRARTADDSRRRASLERISASCWRPVYCYLRRKGYSNEEAKDLTQSFFYEIVLERQLVQKADHSKGRFRTFLLTAIDHYIISVHRKETAKKRLPAQGIIRFDPDIVGGLPTSDSGKGAEHAFNYAWATSILDQVLSELREEYCSTGRSVYWRLFQEKVLLPTLYGAKEPSLPGLCKKHQIAGEKRTSNMLITVKRRFNRLLRQVLRKSVQTDAEVDEEIQDIVMILSAGSARQ